jgi:C4-dicarboxylate-binding protein DctP
MKKLAIISISIFIALCMIGSPALAKKRYVIRHATVIPQKDHLGHGHRKFAEEVEKRTNGDVKITIYYSSQLGSDAETYEMAKAGFLELAAGSTANIIKMTKVFEPLHLPFLFESRAQKMRAVTDPELMKIFNDELAKIGLVWLYHLEVGPRQLQLATRKVMKPEDMQGMKLRASRSPLEIDMHKAFGATSVQLPHMETMEGFKTGMVDGETIPIDALYGVKHYENLKYVGMLNMETLYYPTFVSKRWWDALPDNYKQAMLEAGKAATAWHSEYLHKQVHADMQKMVDEVGLDIYELTPDQIKAFKAKCQPLYEKYAKTTCPTWLVEKIMKAAGPAGDKGWEYTPPKK